MNVISLMTKSELFAGVDSTTLERLRESATEHRLRRGDKLFEENDVANDLYIVTSSRIAIANKSIDGRESVLALMERGDLFGEMSLFDGETRFATVTAARRTRLLRLDRHDLFELIDEQPAIAIGICQTLSRRMRDSLKRVEEGRTERK